LTFGFAYAILKEKGVTPRIEKSAEILGVSLGISAFFSL
jgi:hypothetical protein